jgi:hypothetical protein
VELLLVTVCLAEDAPENCNDAIANNWPGVNLALYGPEHQNETIYDLCLLAGSCVENNTAPNDYVS